MILHCFAVRQVFGIMWLGYTFGFIHNGEKNFQYQLKHILDNYLLAKIDCQSKLFYSKKLNSANLINHNFSESNFIKLIFEIFHVASPVLWPWGKR